MHIRFDQRLTQLLSLSSVVRGQATLSGALPSTAQFSLDSEEAISGFDLGAISVDRGATGRSEMSASIPIRKASAQGAFTPFIFASLGYGELDNPTVFERRKINAWSVGGGIRFIIAPVPRSLTFVGGLDLATAHSNTRPNNTRLSANMAVRF